MDKKVLIIVVVLILIVMGGFAQPNSAALEYAKKGIKLYDEGKFSEAIQQFKKGRSLDPSNSLFSYEIALCYYSMENYDQCIATLDSVIHKKDVNDQFYQLLGDAYDMKKQPDKALEIFKKGIQFFPKAANLYMESGIIEYNRQNYKLAYDYWIRGTQVNPLFGENYYQLSLFYKDSSDKFIPIFFAETYLTLSRNTPKHDEVSKLLYELYSSSVAIANDSIMQLKFVKHRQTSEIQSHCDAFYACQKALNDAKIKSTGQMLSIEDVLKIRSEFIKIWFTQKYNETYTVSLLENQKKILEAGYFDAYTYWLLGKSNVSEYQKWVVQNSERYKEFAEWYSKHPYIIYSPVEINSCK